MNCLLKKINILALILFMGCTKVSSVNFNGEMVIITPENVKVDDVHDEKWRVGVLGKQVISKGVRTEILLPYLKKSVLKKIMKKHSLDSWIVKIKQKSMYRNQNIGYTYFPIIKPGSGRRIKQMKKGVFGIHYAASAVSSRLAQLDCPAFNHSYRVKKMKVENSDLERQEKIYISGASARRIKAKVDPFENRIILNGGDRLRGEYYFELAAYNSNTKKRLSNWIKVNGRVVIGRDEKVDIKGCASVKTPLYNGPSQKKQFKFGQ